MEESIASRVVGWGADLAPEKRPGVPMEREPHPVEGAHWLEPERQPPTRRKSRRPGLRELTPVYGTAQPPRGLSGLMRRAAYRRPDHETRRWALLLFADRVDAFERRLGGAIPLLPAALAGAGAVLALRRGVATPRRRALASKR